MSLLEVSHLNVTFHPKTGGQSHRNHRRNENRAAGTNANTKVVRAVNDVSFTIETGRHFALVGESGSGKSVSCLALTRLIEEVRGVEVSGSIRFDEREIFSMDNTELSHIRGAGISYIFQDPRGQLSDVVTVEELIAETICVHHGLSHREARDQAYTFLEAVGLNDVHRIGRSYPAELSGGMCQRVAISLAIACRPRLLVADEPTTNLDVLRQEEVLDLLLQVSQEFGTTVLMVSHDLGVVRRFCDDCAVMYSGSVVETGTAAGVIDSPANAYTKDLRNSVVGIGGIA